MQLISHVFKNCSKGKDYQLCCWERQAIKNKNEEMNAVEGGRDAIGRILMVAANLKPEFDLLRYLITTVLLSLANSDWTSLKTDKAVLTKTKQSVIGNILPSIIATFIDGGIILHETIYVTVDQHATMACDLLKRVCPSHGDSMHQAFDKYISPPIKDCERKLRRSHTAAALLGPINHNVKLERNF